MTMRTARLVSAAALLALTPLAGTPAGAALPVGAKAPPFSTVGAMAGRQFPVDLRKLLKRGPVVLYFYPAAFTPGCTLEAHAFADASGDFARLGATVIGMSADDLPTLKRFSTEECRSKFAVAVATPAVVQAYDVAWKASSMPKMGPGMAPPAGMAPPPGGASGMPRMEGRTERTSYVISRAGRIVMVHADGDYRDHVRLTLDAVRKLAR